MSDDFAQVLNLLSARHVSELQKFADEFDPGKPPKEKLQTILQEAILIWGELLPDLHLFLDQAPEFAVERVSYPGERYQPIEMSDGERAIFYLVAKTLLAADFTLIIVDEPEMYIHRAIRNRLWDRLERARCKCSFAYFTHDVDFASSRSAFKRIFLRSYRRPGSATSSDRTRGSWDYFLYKSDAELPDEIYLTVLGSRTKVLLVEGQKESLDPIIARAVYPQLLVEPVQSCGQVIRYSGALNHVNRYHHKDVYGLIDSDFRSEQELENIPRASNVLSHNFREIENVLASEAVVDAACANLGKIDSSEGVKNILADQIIARILQLGPLFVGALAKEKARFEFASKFRSGFDKDLKTLVADVDVDGIMTATQTRIDDAISSRKLDKLLAIASIRKNNLKKEIAHSIGFKDWRAYEDVFLSWLRDEKSEAGKRIREAVTSCFPSIPV